MPLFKPNISKMKEKGDIEGLIKLVRTQRKDERILSEAMIALVQIGKPAIDGLIKLLSDSKDNTPILSNAIMVLIGIGETATEPLLTALRELPAHGIVALFFIGKPAVGVLKALLQDEETPTPIKQLIAAQLQEIEASGS